jgi:hypothetical protein
MEHFSDYEEYDEEIENPKKDSLWKDIIRGAVALVLLIAFLFFSGINNTFFYQRTPSTIEQKQTTALMDADELFVPLNIFVLKSEGSAGSERDKENIEHLVTQANKIWEQANISLKINNIYFIDTDEETIIFFFEEPHSFVQEIDKYNTSLINVFLTGHLQGINGISFGGISTIAVADYTTVFDFRAFAHEIGHQLGLNHVPNYRGLLMYQGANGFELSLEEIATARTITKRRFVNP